MKKISEIVLALWFILGIVITMVIAAMATSISDCGKLICESNNSETFDLIYHACLPNSSWVRFEDKYYSCEAPLTSLKECIILDNNNVCKKTR